MKRNPRSVVAGRVKTMLRRRKRELWSRVCCELCLRNVPGRFGRTETCRTTANATALRDQALNS
jgi:hypothetical protein